MNNDFILDTPLKFKLIKSKKLNSQKNLVIVLHGKGDCIKAFLPFQDELRLYNLDFLLINAPTPYLEGFSWYGEPPYKKAGVTRSRILLEDIIEQLMILKYKPENIYFLGYSQGCLMSFEILLHSRIRFGGVIGVSGYFQFEKRWKKLLHPNALKTPILLTHGKQDDVLPIKETYFGVKKLQSAGFQIQWHELNKNHEFIEEDYDLIHNWILNRI